MSLWTYKKLNIFTISFEKNDSKALCATFDAWGVDKRLAIYNNFDYENQSR